MFTKNLPPIDILSVQDAVYQILRRQILHGRFQPGEQLNLKEIELELNVSRTPLKGALTQLENEGLIAIHPRKGTYIKRFTSRDIEECFEIRAAIEAQALRRALEPKNAVLYAEITHLFEQMDTYFEEEATWLDQLLEFMDLDHLAHVKIVALSHNSRMQIVYENANMQGYIAIMGANFFYHDTRKTQAEHRAILAALRARNQEQLIEAARQHLSGACERAIKRLASYKPPEGKR